MKCNFKKKIIIVFCLRDKNVYALNIFKSFDLLDHVWFARKAYKVNERD
jgi:hypothetical protein